MRSQGWAGSPANSAFSHRAAPKPLQGPGPNPGEDQPGWSGFGGRPRGRRGAAPGHSAARRPRASPCATPAARLGFAVTCAPAMRGRALGERRGVEVGTSIHEAAAVSKSERRSTKPPCFCPNASPPWQGTSRAARDSHTGQPLHRVHGTRVGRSIAGRRARWGDIPLLGRLLPVCPFRGSAHPRAATGTDAGEEPLECRQAKRQTERSEPTIQVLRRGA